MSDTIGLLVHRTFFTALSIRRTLAGSFFRVRSVKGLAMVQKSGMYDRKKTNMPKTWRVCLLVTCRGISTTAWIRSGSGSCIPDPMIRSTYIREFHSTETVLLTIASNLFEPPSSVVLLGWLLSTCRQPSTPLTTRWTTRSVSRDRPLVRRSLILKDAHTL